MPGAPLPQKVYWILGLFSLLLLPRSTATFCSELINCPSPKYYCSAQNTCETQLFPLTGRPRLIQAMDAIGIALISLLSGIGSISGISGGAITVPFSLLFFKFLPKQATAFSNVIALSLSLIKSSLLFSRTDPLKKSKTLIGRAEQEKEVTRKNTT